MTNIPNAKTKNTRKPIWIMKHININIYHIAILNELASVNSKPDMLTIYVGLIIEIKHRIHTLTAFNMVAQNFNRGLGPQSFDANLNLNKYTSRINQTS